MKANTKIMWWFAILTVAVAASTYAESPAGLVPADMANKMTGQKQWPVLSLDIAQNALKPPMGWSAWNAFGDNPGPSDQLSREIADALVATGLKDAGYVYLMAFDGAWWSAGVEPGREKDGKILIDAKRWPNGVKAVADYIHSKGLKVAGYTDIGTLGYCCPFQRGALNHEQQDADQYAEWGWDYIKIDDHGPGDFYETCRALANNASKRPIVISLSTPCTFPFEFGPRISNMWRVRGDITVNLGHGQWEGIIQQVDTAEPYWWAQSPGHWNDLDMMVVGLFGISDEEAKSHFSLWSIFGAPLILGCDIRPPYMGSSGPIPKISQQQLNLLKNAEVIAVDQDVLGASARRVVRVNESDVYAKPLGGFTSGVVAALLLNRGGKPGDITVKWTDLGLLGGPATVRDLWAHADLGPISDLYTAKAVPSHGVAMVTVKGAFDWSKPRVYEAESTYNIFTGLAYQRCKLAGFSSNAGVAGVGNGAGNSLQFNHVAVPKAGRYAVAIAYACTNDCTADLCVNGATPVGMSFPRTDGVKELSQDLELKAGDNTLRFGNATKEGLLFDKVTIR